jgi:hypothetical protein
MKHFGILTISAAAAALIMATAPASAQTAYSQAAATRHTATASKVGKVGKVGELGRLGELGEFDFSLLGMASSGDQMPFWAYSNKHGLMPMGKTGAVAMAGWKGNLAALGRNERNQVRLSSGVSGAAYITKAMPGDEGYWYDASKGRKAMVDEAFVSALWRKWTLDIGMRDRKPAGTVWADPFNGLSLAGGDIINSGNARNFLGYTLRTEPLRLFGRLYAYGRWGDYMPQDRRYRLGEMLHMKDLYAMYRFGEHWEVTLGLEHVCQWSGRLRPKMVNGELVEQPQVPKNLGTYVRAALALHGSSSSTKSDQINAEGNHLGRELMKIRYKGNGWSVIAQHDIPFEDGSGMQFLNFPDGITSLGFSLDDKDRIVNSLVFEYVYTKLQSGWGNARWRKATQKEIDKGLDSPSKPGYIYDGYGGDNYFNNGEFQSGWTYYGYTPGLALLTPKAPNSEGLVLGVFNNRISGFHFGIGGRLFHTTDYRVLFTRTNNFGLYASKKLEDGSVVKSSTINPALNQTSAALETSTRLTRHLSVTANLYADRGPFLPHSFGSAASGSGAGGGFGGNTFGASLGLRVRL